MNTTPEMLRALAAGCETLNDGDEKDCETVRSVERTMVVEEGLIWLGYEWYPKEQGSSVDQKRMMFIERQRIFNLCQTFMEIMTGPNPLTKEQIRKLVEKRPQYAIFKKWAE